LAEVCVEERCGRQILPVAVDNLGVTPRFLPKLSTVPGTPFDSALRRTIPIRPVSAPAGTRPVPASDEFGLRVRSKDRCGDLGTATRNGRACALQQERDWNDDEPDTVHVQFPAAKIVVVL
jgi:hypothetical protein